MLRGRSRRFHPFSAPTLPVDRPRDPQGWHGSPDGAPEPDSQIEVDLRGGTHVEPVTPAVSCPACASSMTVEEIDVVGRMARVVCSDCGLAWARRLPSLTQK